MSLGGEIRTKKLFCLRSFNFLGVGRFRGNCVIYGCIFSTSPKIKVEENHACFCSIPCEEVMNNIANLHIANFAVFWCFFRDIKKEQSPEPRACQAYRSPSFSWKTSPYTELSDNLPLGQP